MLISSSRSPSLGQSQIIAKVIISVIGVYLAVKVFTMFIQIIPFFSIGNKEFSLTGIYFYVGIEIVFLVAVIFFMVLKNNWLIRKIMPQQQGSIPLEKQKRFLVLALRIGFVFLGLILLAQSARYAACTAREIVMIPFLARRWFSDIFYGSGIGWSAFIEGFCRILKIVFVVYLIVGSPGLVGCIVKKQLQTHNIKDE